MKNTSYELVPFSYQTAIKIGLKNAFSTKTEWPKNKITLEVPIKFRDQALKLYNVQSIISYKLKHESNTNKWTITQCMYSPEAQEIKIK